MLTQLLNVKIFRFMFLFLVNKIKIISSFCRNIEHSTNVVLSILNFLSPLGRWIERMYRNYNWV